MKGTDADTVDFVEALAAKGFSINEDLQNLYKSLESEFKTEVNMWGNIVEYYHITAPATDGVFASKELTGNNGQCRQPVERIYG